MTSLTGARVLRGPDWEGGDADGGEGYLGTVVRLLRSGEVVVLWDIGNESTCKAGRDGKFALRVFDSAPAGVRHPTVCTACHEDGICGTVFRCRTCAGYDLCTYCYADDKHSIGHEFTRIDYPDDTGHALPRRKMSVRCRSIGIFPGAKVTRGRDWNLKDEDGGPGSEGEVECFEKSAAECQRNRVRVRWSNGRITSCRLGDKGHMDVSCIEEEVGPFYYRDHLALLDSTSVHLATKEETESSTCSGIQLVPCPTTSVSFPTTSVSCPTTSVSCPTTSVSCPTTSVSCRSSSLQKEAELGERTEPTLTTAEGRAREADSGEGAREKEQGEEERQEVGHKKEEKTEKGLTDEQQRLFVQEGLDKRSFVSGDLVFIGVGKVKLKELQRGHGGCTVGMMKCTGKIGQVKGCIGKSTVAVAFDGDSNLTYRFNPLTLVKTSVFQVGDIVRIRPDAELAQILNSQVGWTSPMTATLGKVGKVVEVDKDKNLLVTFGSCGFYFAPALCLHAPGAPTDVVSVESETKEKSSDYEAAPENRPLFKSFPDSLFSHRIGDEGAYTMGKMYAAISRDDDITLRQICQQDLSMIDREYKCLTPLMLAAHRGKIRCTKTLVELGANVNQCISDNVNKTPLSAAMDGRHEDVALFLLSQGADPNHKYHNGGIPIHMAIGKGLNNIVKSLIEHGADVNAKFQPYGTALHMAIIMEMYEIVETLLTAPHLDLYLPDHRGFNVLHLACYMDRPRTLELILDRDRSGVENRRKGHSTALHIAAINDRVQCVRLLVINGGADVNARDSQMATALHVACQLAHFTTVEALLELGADVNVPDTDGDTPLHLAIGTKSHGKNNDAALEVTCRVQIANMLISAGAFVDAKDNSGRKPLTYGMPEVRRRILEFVKRNKDAVKTKHQQPPGGLRLGDTVSYSASFLTSDLPTEGKGSPTEAHIP